MAQFEFIKRKFPNLTMFHIYLCDKAMYNVSAHQQPRYYLPQQIVTTVWTASVALYLCFKQTRTAKMLQNYWLA